MKFTAPIDIGTDEDGVWVAECLAIPGCVSQGSTKDEAVANLREAIDGCIAVRAASGLPPFDPERLRAAVGARVRSGAGLSPVAETLEVEAPA